MTENKRLLTDEEIIEMQDKYSPKWRADDDDEWKWDWVSVSDFREKLDKQDIKTRTQTLKEVGEYLSKNPEVCEFGLANLIAKLKQGEMPE